MLFEKFPFTEICLTDMDFTKGFEYIKWFIFYNNIFDSKNRVFF